MFLPLHSPWVFAVTEEHFPLDCTRPSEVMAIGHGLTPDPSSPMMPVSPVPSVPAEAYLLEALGQSGHAVPHPRGLAFGLSVVSATLIPLHVTDLPPEHAVRLGV